MPDQEIDGAFLYNVWKRTGKTKREVGEMFGLTYGQCAGLIWRHQQAEKGKRQASVKLFSVNIGAPARLGGDWLIVGDVHCPTTDYEMAALVGMVAEQRGLSQLLIAGDLLNQDVFSVHPRSGEPVPWQHEKAAARSLLLEWMDQFERIVWLAGNHERRLSRSTWGALEMVDLRDMIIGHQSNVEVSRYSYCLIDTPNGTWRVTHPRNYSRIPLRTANALAMKYGQHVLSFHEHHLGLAWADNGRNLIANGGGLFDWRRLEYVMLDDSTSPVMNKGFSVLEGGHLTVFGESPYTDWATVLPDAAAAPLRAAA